MAGCLDGVRILELSRFQAGPRCGMTLSDMGAEVIKIEKMGGCDTRKSQPLVKGQSIYFSVYNRGKKSICLDLRQDAGKAVFFDLLKTADMVAENFRPGTLERMGLGYDELIKTKSNIILIRVSGFGQYGPYGDRPGLDAMLQAMNGLMVLTGKPEGKPIGTAFSLVDRTTAHLATIGALGALRHRDQTGQGQIIDVCLMDAALTMVEIPMSYYLATGEEGGELGRRPYEAKDGWVDVHHGSSKKFTKRIHDALGLKIGEDKHDETATRGGAFFGPKIPALIDWCKQHTIVEICKKFSSIDVPVAPVNSIPQVVKDPHLWEREMLVKMEDFRAGELFLPGQSIKFSKTPGKLGPVPAPGQHTDEILSNLLKYDQTKIEQLRAQAVI